MRRIVALLAAALTSCAVVPPSGTPITGEWGGPHVGLSLTAAGGQLEYDCAAGTIGPLVPGAGGAFSAEGTHTPASGGPDVVGQVRPSYQARYSGHVRGDRMTLAGHLANGVELGPFTLRRGVEPGLLRCL